MSIKAMKWAVEICDKCPLPTTAKHVLLVLAHHHCDGTRECRPSMKRLMRITGLGRTSAYEAISLLESSGLIERSARGSHSGRGRRASEYRLFGELDLKAVERAIGGRPKKGISAATRTDPSAATRTKKGTQVPPRGPLKDRGAENGNVVLILDAVRNAGSGA